MRKMVAGGVLGLGLMAATGVSAAAPVSSKLSPRLEASLRDTRRTELVWVFFTDKGAQRPGPLTARGQARRARRGAVLDPTVDAALRQPYVDGVRSRVARLRQESRWFNAVSVEASAHQVQALSALPYVARLDVVRRYRGRPETPLADARVEAASSGVAAVPHALDYGSSLGQLAQLQVPAVHDLGLHGEGVVVAVFDAGFNNLAHEAFAGMTIVARHDFVNGDDDVGDGGMGEGSHGTETLSTLGGYRPGQLIGPAYAAAFILAKTENTDSETPLEEDNWAAAAEWAESLGADVISSSLGYLDFDNPADSYTPAQMDGATAISTRAADLAAERGVVVVNSAGNSGFNAEHNTLGAPADGTGVIAVGAVFQNGTRVSFSSVGPSADGRIKPDVAAQGVAVKVASPAATNLYVASNGTSFSCPLTAGVAALVLQAHPDYSPAQVGAVLRQTASQASAPDTLLGYGIVNALAAIQAPAP